MCQTHTLQQYVDKYKWTANTVSTLKNKENTSYKTRKALNIRKQTPINENVLE